MSEDKDKHIEDKKRVDWVIPIAEEVDVSNLTAKEINELHKKGGIIATIDAGSSTKKGGVRVNISKTIVEGMPAPKKIPDKKEK